MDAWVGYIQHDKWTEDVTTGATPDEALAGARAAAVRQSLDGRVLAFCARPAGTPLLDPSRRERVLANRFNPAVRTKNKDEGTPAPQPTSEDDTRDKRRDRIGARLLEQEFLRRLGYGACETNVDGDDDDAEDEEAA